jgi:hypothetical protein
MPLRRHRFDNLIDVAVLDQFEAQWAHMRPGRQRFIPNQLEYRGLPMLAHLAQPGLGTGEFVQTHNIFNCVFIFCSVCGLAFIGVTWRFKLLGFFLPVRQGTTSVDSIHGDEEYFVSISGRQPHDLHFGGPRLDFHLDRPLQSL